MSTATRRLVIGAPLSFLSANTPCPSVLSVPIFVAPALTGVGGPELSSNPGNSAAVGVTAPYTPDTASTPMIGSVNERNRSIFMA